jgi:hypothetical protein
MYTHCQNCHKQLKNPIYQEIGYGKVCLSKIMNNGLEVDEFDSDEQAEAFERYTWSQTKFFYCDKTKEIVDNFKCTKRCDGYVEFCNHCIHRFRA